MIIKIFLLVLLATNNGDASKFTTYAGEYELVFYPQFGLCGRGLCVGESQRQLRAKYFVCPARATRDGFVETIAANNLHRKQEP